MPDGCKSVCVSVLELHQNDRKKKKKKKLSINSVRRQRCSLPVLYCLGSAGTRTSKVAMHAAQQWRGESCVALFCLCAAALWVRDARRCDYGRRSGRAGTGRIEWRAGRAFYMSMPVFLYTLPSQQPTVSLNVPNASLAPEKRGACLSSLILGLKWRSTCTKQCQCAGSHVPY